MRASFDRLISWTGILLAVFLVIAAGVLWYTSSFIANEVKTQLTMQDITMPQGAALDSLPPDDKAALEPYAGSPMDTGPEAKAYADHYILVHLNGMAGGKSYSQVSADYLAMSPEQKASPEGLQAAQLRMTMFMGNTLRGLLLFGYAFATIGTIAGYAAIGCLIGAVILLVLGILGLRHANRLEKSGAASPPPVAV